MHTIRGYSRMLWSKQGKFLLSFQQFLSVGAAILHQVAQCTWNFPIFLLTNLQKCLENIIFSRRIEPSVFPEISFWFTLQLKMYFFKHFQRLVNKIQKNVPFRTFFRQNWPISIFFGTPCEGKLGWNQLQYTFPDQWNTFCFMNFAQKFAVEPIGDPKKWKSKEMVESLLKFQRWILI